MIVSKEFINLKRLIYDNKYKEFEKIIKSFTIDNILEFGNYYFSSNNIKAEDDYYNNKVFAEIVYLTISLNLNNYKAWSVCLPVLLQTFNKALGNQYYMDAFKYGTKALECPDIKIEDKISLLNNLGVVTHYLGDYKNEKYIFGELIKINSSNYLYLYNYAVSLASCNEHLQAIDYFKKCLAMEEFPPAYNNHAASVIHASHNYKLAVEYVEKAIELYYKNPAKYPLVNPNNYIVNCILFCSISGSNDLLFKLNQYLVTENNNKFLCDLIDMGITLNIAISKLNDLDIDEANIYFEISRKSINKLLKNIPSGFERIKLILDNIEYFLELTKLIMGLNMIMDLVKSRNEYKNVIENLNIIRLRLKEVKNTDYFNFYNFTLDNYIALIIDAINLIVYDKKLDEKDFYRKTKIIEQSNITSHLLSSYVHKSFEIKEIILQYLEDSQSPALVSILKESCKNKLINIVSDPKDIINKLEFVIYGDKISAISADNMIIDLAIKCIKSMQKVEPSFIRNYKNNTTNSLLESDFRENFYGKLSMIFEVTAEELSKDGRTDLIIKSKSFGERIFEFKVWGRNDYKEVVKQINSYLIDMNNVGYIIMINPNKNSINNQYFNLIKSEDMNYIQNSYEEIDTIQFKYFRTKHNSGFEDKIIYHFIYNLF